MLLEGKKIAVLLADLFEDVEFWYPYLRMKEAGAEVHSIGKDTDVYKGKNGTTAKADKSIKDVKADDYDAVIVPGGYSPDHMRRTPDMVDFVKDIGAKHKTAAAICHGPWVLASAGLLKGRRLTSFFSIRDDIINAGGEWTDAEVVRDENIITSRNPNDLPAFCREIINSLGQ